jgi:hypothetical protein
VPCEAHLAAGVAGCEQAEQLVFTGLVEAFVGLGEQPAGSVERVGLVASVAEGLLLHPAAALIELRVLVLDHVERVGDLGGVRKRVGEGLAVGAGEVQHAPADSGPPGGWLVLDPGGGARRGATRHDFEQL